MNEDSTAVILKLSADYYAHRVGNEMSRETRDRVAAAVQRGISGAQVMDAIDAAVATYGMGASARDMQAYILDELRGTWRKMQAQGLISANT